MRLLGSFALLALFSAGAQADSAVAYVDDEPMSGHAAATSSTTAPPATTTTSTTPAATTTPATRTVAPSDAPAAPRRAVDRRTPAETGQLRSIAVAAPSTVSIPTGGAVSREHDVAPPPSATAATAPTTGDSSELFAELAARQMRRHQPKLDACIAAAQRKHPTAGGTITLDFEIADRKVANVHVASDGIHDPALATCLTTTARGLSFALASAHFTWPVSASPSALAH